MVLFLIGLFMLRFSAELREQVLHDKIVKIELDIVEMKQHEELLKQNAGDVRNNLIHLGEELQHIDYQVGILTQSVMEK